VAKCERCREAFRITEPAADPFRGLSHLCRFCRLDLSDSVREHLISCTEAARLAAGNVVAEAKALRETSAAIRKDAHKLRDAAGLLRAESEAERQAREVAFMRSTFAGPSPARTLATSPREPSPGCPDVES
jgi:hypothetical protein